MTEQSEERGPAWDTYGLDQAVIESWIRRTFSDAIMDDPRERALRIAEEALELAQTQGVTAAQLHALVSEVYRKPVGEVRQEVGGLGTTMLAFCAQQGLRLDDEVKREIDRIVSTHPDAFRKKQSVKEGLGLAIKAE